MAYFAASVDTPETNRRFAASLGLDYPILSDPDKQVAEAFGVLIPAIRIASRATVYIGVDGRILYVDRSVKPWTHGRDVVARLGMLGVRRRP